MQLINQKEQLDAKISESKSINDANLLKLKEEIEKDGKFSIFHKEKDAMSLLLQKMILKS